MEQGEIQTTSVRGGLGKILRDRMWVPVVEDFSRRITLMSFKAAILMNVYLSEELRKGRPCPTVNQTVCYQALTLVSGGSVKEKYATMREAYELAIAPHENHGNTPVATNLSQSKSFVGNQMATQYKNYMDDALGKHQRYYLRAKYGLSKYDARWIAGKVRTIKPTKLSSDQESFAGIVAQERAIYTSARRTHPGKTKYRQLMLDAICRADPDSTRYQRFVLFPLFSLRRKFFRVDKKVAASLYSRGKQLGIMPDDAPPIQELSELVDFSAVRKRDRWVPGASFVTDGVQAHTGWKRPRTTAVDDPLPDRDTDLYDVTGIDPGNRNVVTAARHLPEGGFCHWKLSKGEHYSSAGATKTSLLMARAKRRTKHGKRVALIEADWSRAPLSTSSRAGICEAVRVRLKSCASVLSFYFRRKWAYRRFSAARLRESHLDRLSNRIGRSSQYVSFGNGKFAAGIRGALPGGPVKELRSRVKRKYPEKVLICDEYLTSQRCSSCGSQLEKMKRGKRTIHGLCQCKAGCHRTWSRDVNACLNMVRVMVAHLAGKSRPCELTRGNDSTSFSSEEGVEACSHPPGVIVEPAVETTAYSSDN